ncbi:MAG TPA: AI-2E family transporter [Anaerolineales bacterium]|nr:AI-2E family transporter [Anaerolineales bacterium]
MAANIERRPWSIASKFLAGVVLLAVSTYLLFRFSLMIPPFILAVILAYVLSPVAGALQRRLRIRRGLATVFTYVILLGLGALLPALFVPSLVQQLSDLNVNVQEIAALVESLLSQDILLGGLRFNLGQLGTPVIEALRALAEPVFGRTLGIAFDVISSFIWAVFIVVVSFYLVKDSARLKNWAKSLPPESLRADAQRLAGEINDVWGAFFRGQLVLALVVAGIITMLSVAVGMPYALAMGVLAGLLEFLPSIGHGIWLFTASVLLFFQGSTWLPIPNWAAMLLVIGLHAVFQQVDLNYLIPRIIGGRVRLHPLVVILGIVAGAAVAGVLGIVLAAPTIASARILGRYTYSRIFDLEPFPEGQEGTA